MPTSRKVMEKLGLLVTGLNELANCTVILGTSALNVARETNIADFSIPLLGNSQQAIGSIPFADLFFGALKVISSCRRTYIVYTSSDPALVTKNYINAIFEFISGSMLLSSFAAYELSALQVFTVFPSIAFSYIGFSISACIDFIESIGKICRYYSYKDKNVEMSIPEIKEYHSAIADCLISLLKCIGWSALAYSSIFLGAGSIVVAIGWAFVGGASLFQLLKCAPKTVSFVGRLFSPKSSNEKLVDSGFTISSVSVSDLFDDTSPPTEINYSFSGNHA